MFIAIVVLSLWHRPEKLDMWAPLVPFGNSLVSCLPAAFFVIQFFQECKVFKQFKLHQAEIYPVELLDTQMHSHRSVISMAPYTAGGDSATNEKAASVTCSLSTFPHVWNYLNVHIKWTAISTCPERLLWWCVEFACKFGLDVFPSYYDTGGGNSIALDNLRHQFNECRKEVFDPLLKSASVEPAPVHMLFELGLQLFYPHTNHGKRTVSQWGNTVFCVFL